MKKTSILNITQFGSGNSVEGFYANTLQDHLVTSHKDIALPHSHDFYLSILFTKGTGIHEVDFMSYDVKPGSLFFLNPGQTHHWELSPDVEGYIFFHTAGFYDLHYTHSRLGHFPFFYSLHSSPCLYIEGQALARITGLFTSILEENLADALLKKQRLLSLADLVYIESTRLYAGPDAIPASNNGYYARFRKLEHLVEEHFRHEKSPAAYAGMMAMTPKHLNRITQAVAGKTTSDIVTERVLLEAKKELILQRDSFNEIAASLGYDDYAYFSRLFKKKTGETPSGFLKRYGR